jgi:uncharacterized protein
VPPVAQGPAEPIPRRDERHDDERPDYIYKFVSTGKYKPCGSAHARRHNSALLDESTLYVATFTGDSPGEFDGSGTLSADGEFDGTRMDPARQRK